MIIYPLYLHNNVNIILKFLFNKKHTGNDYRQIFLDFNRSLNNIKDKSALISSMLTRIYELIPAKAIHLFWESVDGSVYQSVDNISFDKQVLKLHSDDGLIRWLRLNERPLMVSSSPEYINIFSENDTQVIHALHCVLVCPLKANNQFKGVLFLEERTDRQSYHSHDMELLSVLLDSAALAIENIIYQDERVNHLKRIFRADRMAVIGQLAAGAAHEIRNPLTSIKSAMQYIQGDIIEPKKQMIMNSALLEVERINKILTGLLSFSRQNEPVKQTFDLVSTIEQTLNLIENTRINKQIQFTASYFASTAKIIADVDQIKQVLINIILNAVDAIENTGIIDIDLKLSKFEDVNYYIITITDNGIGIVPENIEKTFDPFYTTKEEGTGLGLSISYGIIHRHRGNIEIDNRSEGGVKVRIQLPVADNGNTSKKE